MQRRPRWHEISDWYRTLYRHGWVAPHWPREHGGMGLAPEKLLILYEEQERWGVARTPDHGINMLGPILIRYGTAEQRAYYLPRILSGEHLWCQGYSEPGAGSDLASLRTEAVREGGDFVLNGQKIWTTLAQDSTHMFLLARTNKEARKQAGISFILLDCKSPGVTIRPIRNIADNEEFNQVFLDSVRVPVGNLVGEIDNGWTVAKSVLWLERLNAGSPKRPQYALGRLERIARDRGLFADEGFLDRFTCLHLDVADLAALYARFAERVKIGEPIGPDVGMLKLLSTETLQRISELLVEVCGEDGCSAAPVGDGDERTYVLDLFLNARQTTIAGGSSEVQRNILAKQVLELPAGAARDAPSTHEAKR